MSYSSVYGRGRYVVTTGEEPMFHSRHRTESEAKAVAEQLICGSWWPGVVIPPDTKVEIAKPVTIWTPS